MSEQINAGETLKQRIEKLTLKDLKESLEKHGLYYSNEMIRTLFYALRNPDTPVTAVLLEGAPGVGKTALTEALAKILGAKYLVYQFTPQTNEKSLFYDIVPDENTKSGFSKQPGILMRAVLDSQKEPVIVTLDEIDKADETTDAFLLSFLQNATLPIGTETLKGNPDNLIIFLTSNNNRQLSEPLRRRILSIDVEPPPPSKVYELMSKKYPAKIASHLTGLYALSLKLWEEGNVSRPLSIQDLRQYGGYLANVEKLEGITPPLTYNDFYRFLYKNAEDASALYSAVESGELGNLDFKLGNNEERKVELDNVLSQLANKTMTTTESKETNTGGNTNGGVNNAQVTTNTQTTTNPQTTGEANNTQTNNTQTVPSVVAKVNEKFDKISEPEFEEVDLSKIETEASGLIKNTSTIRDRIYKMLGAFEPNTECGKDWIKGNYGECMITKDNIVLKNMSLKALNKEFAEDLQNILLEDNSGLFIFEDELPVELDKNKLKEIGKYLANNWVITGFKDNGEEKFINAIRKNNQSTQAINIISKNGKTIIYYGIRGNNQEKPSSVYAEDTYLKPINKILEIITGNNENNELKPKQGQTYNFDEFTSKLYNILTKLKKTNYKKIENELMKLTGSNNFNEVISQIIDYYKNLPSTQKEIFIKTSKQLLTNLVPRVLKELEKEPYGILSNYKDLLEIIKNNYDRYDVINHYYGSIFNRLLSQITDTSSLEDLKRIKEFLDDYGEYLVVLAEIMRALRLGSNYNKISLEELKQAVETKEKLLRTIYGKGKQENENNEEKQELLNA